MRNIKIPGRPTFELDHLLLDVNGTLTNRGDLIGEVETKLAKLQETLNVHLLSADTFGLVTRAASMLGVQASIVHDAGEKVAIVRKLGPQNCAAIGNGRNDEGMLKEAALGIAVIGPEGTATATLIVADIVCRSIDDALDLLLDDRAIAATLRP